MAVIFLVAIGTATVGADLGSNDEETLPNEIRGWFVDLMTETYG